ncbi:MAG: phosphatidate cytidylyltransferase [Ruminococcus sp.]|nr:phosphatidate cytidylyltransferase [Ruminococcus sp.]
MRTRIISAAVAIAFAIFVLALAHTWVFNLTLAAIAVGALYELFKALGLIKYRAECAVCFAFASVDMLIGMVYRKDFFTFFNVKIYGLLFVTGILLLYLKNRNSYAFSLPFTLIGITLIICYSFHTLLWMVDDYESFGVFAVVLTLAGAWLADSGAYFVGTFFGKNKLCPEISPKKTIEGVVGGTVVNGVLLLIISGVYTAFINKDVEVRFGVVFIAGMLCAIVGLVGDLAASEIKRQAGIKDYGNIMPGHGGIMDRFDSVLTVAPFMYWLISQGWIVKF